MKTKTIQIHADVHKMLRIEAAKKDTKMIDLIRKIVKEALK